MLNEETILAYGNHAVGHATEFGDRYKAKNHVAPAPDPVRSQEITISVDASDAQVQVLLGELEQAVRNASINGGAVTVRYV